MREVIDIFCHALPASYLRFVSAKSKHAEEMLARAARIPAMTDPEARFRLMDRFSGYRQVLSLASPPVETLLAPAESVAAARCANDGLAKAVAAHPDRFPGFVAALPMGVPDAARAEIDRACGELGAVGVQVFTNVNGRPLDEERTFSILAHALDRNLPVWLHPARGAGHPDYIKESDSKFELWWALGWPCETSTAMLRLVFAGLFDCWPDAAIVTHHAGGIVPMLEGRLRLGMQRLGSRTPADRSELIRTSLRVPPVEAVTRFHADTATFGSLAALQCGLSFFGVERMLFASDFPFGPEEGRVCLAESLNAIEALDLSDADRDRICSGNARALLQRSARNGNAPLATSAMRGAS